MTNLVEKQVTCPHCWSSFFGDRAFYISQHEDLYGDPVLGDVPARVSPHEVTRSRNGKVLDSKGWEMLERACPTCRLQVPPEIIAERPKFLSIVGAPGSGKTYFITVMLHQLRKTLAKQFRYTLDLCDTHDKQLLVANERKLFNSIDPTAPVMLGKTQEQGGDLYNMIKLDGVDVQLPKPFMLTLRRTTAGASSPMSGRQLSMVLYDNAGESFQFGKDSGKNRSTRHLGESDAVLFAYDPLLEPEMRMRLARVSDDPQISSRARSARQLDFLTTTIQQMRRHSKTSADEPLEATLAICVQKFDVWRTFVDHCVDSTGQPVIDATSIEYFIEHGVAALDISEINVVSQIIRSLLLDVSPEFVSKAEANFNRVRYFPVSALGHSPRIDGDFLKIAPLDMQPFRVEHPLLWLMRDWKMIARTRDRKPNLRNYPAAKIESVSRTRLQVRCPESQELLTLDHDFAGSDFYNPNTLKYFWIPAITDATASRVSTTQTNAPPKVTPVSQGLGLKLGQSGTKPSQKPKKKKGWFR